MQHGAHPCSPGHECSLLLPCLSRRIAVYLSVSSPPVDGWYTSAVCCITQHDPLIAKQLHSVTAGENWKKKKKKITQCKSGFSVLQLLLVDKWIGSDRVVYLVITILVQKIAFFFGCCKIQDKNQTGDLLPKAALIGNHGSYDFFYPLHKYTEFPSMKYM